MYEELVSQDERLRRSGARQAERASALLDSMRDPPPRPPFVTPEMSRLVEETHRTLEDARQLERDVRRYRRYRR
jgi:hypothetical protein